MLSGLLPSAAIPAAWRGGGSGLGPHQQAKEPDMGPISPSFSAVLLILDLFGFPTILLHLALIYFPAP